MMIITNISLKNWKNFSELKVKCSKLMFIIGHNATGKSNLLDAIIFLRDIARYGFQKAIISVRGGVENIKYINSEKSSDISLIIDIDNTYQYKIAFEINDENKALIKEEALYRLIEGKWETIFSRPDEGDKGDPLRLTQSALEQVNQNSNFRDLCTFFSTITLENALPQFFRDPGSFSIPSFDKFSFQYENDPFGRDFIMSMWKMPKKERTTRFRKINDRLKLLLPNFRELKIEQDEAGFPHLLISFQDWPIGLTQNEKQFSDGTVRLIALLWSLLDESDAPLLLENIEIYLSEDVQHRLTCMFMSEIEKHKRQIFITTHKEKVMTDQKIGVFEIFQMGY